MADPSETDIPQPQNPGSGDSAQTEQIEVDTLVESTRGQRWKRFSRTHLAIGGGFLLVFVASGVGAVWNFATESSEPTAPEIEISVESKFTVQLEEILAGKNTRLHFADLPIDDEILNKIPFEELQSASEKAAKRALAEKKRREERKLLELSTDAEENQLGQSVAPSNEDSSTYPLGVDAASEPIVRLDTVLIDQGVVTDVGLAELGRLPDLEHLRLRLSPITDDGIVSLAGCQKLWLLNLPHSRLTIEGIRSLRNFPSLKQLRLGSPKLSGECCRAIAELKSLRGLHLIGIAVTDDGLKMLATLPRLESLYLDDSEVTDIGWKWLFQNHPQLHVHVNQRHHDRDPHAHKH